VCAAGAVLLLVALKAKRFAVSGWKPYLRNHADGDLPSTQTVLPGRPENRYHVLQKFGVHPGNSSSDDKGAGVVHFDADFARVTDRIIAGPLQASTPWPSCARRGPVNNGGT